MRPYYEHGGIAIYHGDQRDVLPSLADDADECCITDPPYSPAFHEGARTGDQDTPLVDFAKDEGRKAIGIEREERYCELAARRLGQEVLFS